jgi:hypothetical protein
MKVQIVNEDGRVIWERDSANKSGISSRSYINDGTQDKIIEALQHALEQAKGQALTFKNSNRGSNVSTTAT